MKKKNVLIAGTVAGNFWENIASAYCSGLCYAALGVER